MKILGYVPGLNRYMVILKESPPTKTWHICLVFQCSETMIFSTSSSIIIWFFIICLEGDLLLNSILSFWKGDKNKFVLGFQNDYWLKISILFPLSEIFAHKVALKFWIQLYISCHYYLTDFSFHNQFLFNWYFCSRGSLCLI